MALPTTIIAAAGVAGHHPIIKSSAGNFYYFGHNASGVLTMYKATDPSVSWGSPVDSPALDDLTSCIALRQKGDIIHIGKVKNTGSVEYYEYNMADDTFRSAATYDITPDNPSNNPDQAWIDVEVRNDGDILLVVAGDTDNVMGGAKQRVDYILSSNGASSWDAPQAVDAAGDVHYGQPNIIKGPLTDDMHIEFNHTDDTNDDPPIINESIDARTLDPTNTLSTVVNNTADNGGSLLGMGNMVAYEDAATQRIGFLGALDATDIIAWRATEDGSDDIQAPSNATATTNDIFINGEVGILTSAVDDTGEWHCLFSGGGTAGVDQNIYYMSSTDDGATWSAPTLELNPTGVVNYLCCDIYQRGVNKVLGYWYDEAGTVKYNEKNLTALAYTQLDHATMEGIVNQYVGPFEI